MNVDFELLENIDDIGLIFSIESYYLRSVLRDPNLFYIKKKIPKKGKINKGNFRFVHQVKFPLSNFQKNISAAIYNQINFPVYVQGFTKDRSIYTNASRHLAKRYVLNFDIKDFFDSINTQQVTEAFKKLKCKENIADIFAKLCTYNNKLVQGASTSPPLANLVCSELDMELLELSRKYECSYSRYADDITFSGDRLPPKKDVKQSLNKFNFALNTNKYISQIRGRQQYVTGLTVFDEQRPRMSKGLKRKIRQHLYYADRYGLESHLDKVNPGNPIGTWIWIDGIIAFLYSVEPEYALKFDLQWQQILLNEDLKPSRKEPHDIYNRQMAKKIF